MTKERRTEIIIEHIMCLLNYFTFDREETEVVQKEICKGCSERLHCENTWRPWLEKEIKGILDNELKREVIHERG